LYILGVDTTTELLSIALSEDSQLIDAVELDCSQTHTEVLFPQLNHLLNKWQLEMRDIGLLVVDIGPGMFTGTRVGVVAQKTMAIVLGIPLVGLTSLEMLASQVDDKDGLICPLIDARRGEVYLCVFEQGDGELVPVTQNMALPPQGLVEFLSSLEGKIILCGSGAARYRGFIQAALSNISDQMTIEDRVIFPSARIANQKGYRRYLQKQLDDPLGLLPLYVRQPVSW
jgi:tRNA threonylcarbamoyladenosine biosynthesis protein TsaB